MKGDGEGLEIEIAQGDGDQQGVDQAGVEECRPVGFRPDDEAADDKKGHPDQNEDRKNIDEE